MVAYTYAQVHMTATSSRRARERIKLVVSKIVEVDKALEDDKYKEYRVELKILRKTLLRILRALVEKGRANTRTTYILPSMLYLAKRYIYNKTSLNEVLAKIRVTRLYVRRLFRVLVRDYGLKLYIPSNLGETVEVHAWSDYLGETMDKRKLVALTLWFKFPFDIYEHDNRSEYEPVTFVFSVKAGNIRLEKVYARVHYDVYDYIPTSKNISILFTRSGHTPIILSSKIYGGRKEVSIIGVAKTLLDMLWLKIAPVLTRMSGVRVIDVGKRRRQVHLYVDPVLVYTRNNPFPYLFDVTI